mmetsp:Transcript_9514/g.38837  ORF Transcript_9514/g.38837 Transcript_9514/m.38837 type:complete len:113 (-) Transcript_9514:702-1040(-)
MVLCCGVTTAAFLANPSNDLSRVKVQVVVACELDGELRKMLEQRFQGRIKVFKYLRVLHEHLLKASPEQRTKIKTDVIEITAPCQGRTKLRQVNRDLEPHQEDDLSCCQFLL